MGPAVPEHENVLRRLVGRYEDVLGYFPRFGVDAAMLDCAVESLMKLAHPSP